MGDSVAMGMLLWLETEPELPAPPAEVRERWRRRWDDKCLIAILGELQGTQWLAPDGARVSFGQALGIDTGPLEKTAGQELGLADYVELVGEADAERVWRERAAQDATAWQPPAVLAGCLWAALAALERHPQVVDGVPDSYRYYGAGGIPSDLAQLLDEVEWDAAYGAQRVRLVIA